MLDSLELLSDENCTAGLRYICRLGAQQNQKTQNSGDALVQLFHNAPQNQSNIGPPSTIPPGNLGLTIPSGTKQDAQIPSYPCMDLIKTEDVKMQPSTTPFSETPDQRPLSYEDFDKIVKSPKGKGGGGGGRKRPNDNPPKPQTPKKPKSVINEPTLDEMLGKAEAKRKAIRDCNDILKVNRPTNENPRYMLDTTKNMGRQLCMGPSPPHAFYKIMAKWFPEYENMTPEEVMPLLMHKLSRFVMKNVEWTEVCTFF